jgi:uracil-DNA glycosylase
LPRVRVIVALGAFAWDAALRTITSGGVTPIPRPRPKFGHGTETVVGSHQLIGSLGRCHHLVVTRSGQP